MFITIADNLFDDLVYLVQIWIQMQIKQYSVVKIINSDDCSASALVYLLPSFWLH